VPGGGLPVWATPDASAPTVAALDPGLAVLTVQRWGDWAAIVCSNGWGGWVDGRALLAATLPPSPAPSPAPAPSRAPEPTTRLTPAPPPPAPQWPGAGGAGVLGPPAPPAAPWAPGPPAPAPTAWTPPGTAVPRPTPLPTASWVGLPQAFRWPPPPWLAGAVLVLLGVFVSWSDIAGFGTGAFDIPIQFLVDRTEVTGGIKVGLLVLVLLALAVVAWARPHHPLLGQVTGAVWGQIAGGLVLVVAAAFALQWHRYLGIYPEEQRPGYVGSLGVGLYLTIVGGALLVVGDRAWPRGRR
jgi:hypothetical protein